MHRTDFQEGSYFPIYSKGTHILSADIPVAVCQLKDLASSIIFCSLVRLILVCNVEVYSSKT